MSELTLRPMTSSEFDTFRSREIREYAIAQVNAGYGRSLLRAVEQEIIRRGIGVIGLNVFGSNMVARNLYETAGYQINSMHLRKKLLPTD